MTTEEIKEMIQKEADEYVKKEVTNWQYTGNFIWESRIIPEICEKLNAAYLAGRQVGIEREERLEKALQKIIDEKLYDYNLLPQMYQNDIRKIAQEALTP